MNVTIRPFLALPLVLGFVAGDLVACNGRKSGAKPLARVYQVSATSWNVYVPGWITVATPKDTYCAAGLSVAGVIQSVDSMAMFHDTNSSSIQAFQFAKSAAVATNLQAKQAGSWTGFLAQASTAVAAGVPNLYCFSVTTTSGATFAQVEAALKAGYVGSDKSDAQGKLAGSNQVIFQFTTVENDTCARNLKMFHNVDSSNLSGRLTVDKADTLYFMQPRMFRYGQGEATGWRALFQDQDPSTAELVELGYVSYANSTSDLPNVTSAGTLTAVEFSLFGAGGSNAVEWTLTTAGKVALPSYSGIKAVLPAPQGWPTDGLTVHTQEGGYTNVPAALRKQVTYSLQGSSATAFLAAGSTHHLGGLYDCPVTQVHAVSKAYGPTRRLMGPEAVQPNPKGGDLLGFSIRSERFKAPASGGTFALVMIAAGYQPRPLPTPYKALLVTPFVTTALVVLDTKGEGTSIGFPVGPDIQLAAQTILLRFLPKLDQLFTDAARIKALK